MIEKLEAALVKDLANFQIQRPNPTTIHLIDLAAQPPQLWVIRIEGPHDAPWPTK